MKKESRTAGRGREVWERIGGESKEDVEGDMEEITFTFCRYCAVTKSSNKRFTDGLITPATR
ncbi:hypothetical protein E2C01_026767 [Portunus trituberculatus]|uniref:Uncharacterized protein n=1 Tax=Portunus trituberculatus TaxID=210409 RepID=A0A5B7EJ90_PORTR|nr:hypothetical protein [Portunus trituberculatus]